MEICKRLFINLMADVEVIFDLKWRVGGENDQDGVKVEMEQSRKETGEF